MSGEKRALLFWAVILGFLFVLGLAVCLQQGRRHKEAAQTAAVTHENQEQLRQKIAKAARFNNAFLEAFDKHDFAAMEQAIAQGSNINVRNANGVPAIVVAAGNGDTETVHFLLDHGADVNARSKYGVTPLLKAVGKHDTELVRFLLEKGARPNDADNLHFTPLIQAVRGATSRSFMRSLADNHEPIPEHMGDNVEIIRLLLQYGADVHRQAHGQATALIFLAMQDDPTPEIAEMLFNAGANINDTDAHGNTPLMFAALKDNQILLRQFLQKGANPSAQNKDGLTPLMLAAGGGHIGPVVELLNANANPNLQDAHGRTALMWALERDMFRQVEGKVLADNYSVFSWSPGHDRDKIVETLVARGADISLKDDQGNTALDQAQRIGAGNAVTVLVRALNQRNKPQYPLPGEQYAAQR